MPPRRDAQRKRPYVVLYDGGCGLCSRTAAWLRRLDLLGRLQFVDFNHEWERLSAAYPTLDRTACDRAMHVIAQDGGITAGFDGFRALAWGVPPLWLALPVLYVPGVPLIGRRVYAWVAAHRRAACVVPHNGSSRT